METPLKVQQWYLRHHSCCHVCQAWNCSGSWAWAKEHNEENTCYISHILAFLWHGYVIPLKELPTEPIRRDNYDTIAMAPAAVAKEWSKMTDNSVMHRPGPGEPEPLFVSPLQAVVKQSDIEDAVAELLERQHPLPPAVASLDLQPDDEDGDRVIPLKEVKDAADQLNAALEASGSPMRVKVRLCIDCSVTINLFTTKLSMCYPPVDQLLSKLSKGGWLCKVDYRRCFFNIPLHRAMYTYMGARAPDGSIWVAHRVLFGITTGPHIASILTAETAWIISNRRLRSGARVPIEVYMDDNAITGCTEEECYEARELALDEAAFLGWPVAEDKLAEDKPAQRLAYRGVVFDTVAETLSIPPTKLQCTLRRIIDMQELASSGKVVSVRKIRSVLGRLGWISQVLPLGRLHTHELSLCAPGWALNIHRRKLTEPALSDLAWWRQTLQDAVEDSGLAAWTSFAYSPEVVRIISDASGTIGFGGFSDNIVVAGTWKPEKVTNDAPAIQWKEFVPVYLLLRELAPSLAPGTSVLISTDNEPNAFDLNKACARQGGYEMLELIWSLACRYQLRVYAEWIPRDLNTLCDLLSRLRPLPGRSK